MTALGSGLSRTPNGTTHRANTPPPAFAGASGGGPGTGTRLQTPLPARERRPGRILLLVALVVGLAAFGGYLHAQAGHKKPVVVVARDVPAGHAITRADLTTELAAGDLSTISKAQLDSVVGQTAVVHLMPHMLLQTSMITTAAPLGGDQAQVGVSVPAGQLPADGVAPGDTVRVLGLPPKDAVGGQSGTASVLVERAEVFSARADSQSAGSTVVTLVLSVAQANAVAASGSQGLVALVKVGRS